LGLANDAALRDAVHESTRRLGVGSGSSRLVVGDTTEHRALEADLASFERTESALLFNSGYAANVGAISALCGAGDVVFSDALNHASIIDGCRLSRARTVVYPHRDVEALERLVSEHPGRRRLVVTDAVFSMDGDLAPLRALAGLCEQRGLGLMVDEAHATGVLGPRGAGLSEMLGVTPDVVMGTLSKAIGAMGAYVAGASVIREVLLNQARSLVFSTSLPASMCAAARAGLRALGDGARRAQLWRNIEQLALGLGVEARSSIFSVIVGEPSRALAVAAALRERGLLVKAIRPPTVPPGTSRLRLAVTALHTSDDIARLVEAVQALGQHPLPRQTLANGPSR
jgi:8-amino-7-oxononanoate synthase